VLKFELPETQFVCKLPVKSTVWNKIFLDPKMPLKNLNESVV